MGNTFNYILNFLFKDNKVFASIEKIEQQINAAGKSAFKFGKTIHDVFNGLRNQINTIHTSAILDQLDRVADGLANLSTPGLEFTTSMADLQAITGLTGDKLKQIGDNARAAGIEFGGGAAQGVEAYKLILSKLGPDIANTPAALDKMGNSVNVLSKTMGGDAVAATETLTTAMNQFQVSTDDPMKAAAEMANMMNIMAAAAKEGSAELPQIKQALEQSGLSAKMAGVSFAEVNSAIQVLDKAGKQGAEGGVAIRNVLAVLSEGRFLPKQTREALEGVGIDINKLADKSLTFSDRLKILKPVMGDTALITKLFGKENSNAALALLSGTDVIDQYTKAITGTNTAYEQAAIVMDSPAEKMKRMQARIDDMKIGMFELTGGYMAYATVAGQTARDIGGLIPLFSALTGVITTLTSAEKLKAFWDGVVTNTTAAWTVAQNILNAAFWANPITWIVAGIIALIATIAIAVNKVEGWGQAWQKFMELMKYQFAGAKAFLTLAWLGYQEIFLQGIELLEKAWYRLSALWDKDSARAGLEKIASAQNERAAAIAKARNDVIDNGNKSLEAVRAIGKSLKWKTGKDAGASEKGTGITLPKIPGMSPASASSGGAGVSGSSAKGKGKSVNDAIATGGTKTTNVTLNIGKLIESVYFNKGDNQANTSAMQEEIIQGVIRALNMAQSQASD
ncbi:phage tail tape measure protein [Chitinophaga pendula]|uniref:phage tail tape measure protein n=1 Tax=Chitinophaga TaxID=79328 RepID=UPI000BAF0447|nr:MULTISPECIES: phage tail tape measure protein [Chitinophaga]ASZ11097.1 phage tail tape measure protein [Chitinophaga sp. MD30]UCJ05905.1 phage tail tape measure protein [Chitinophaga pendula]